MKLGKLKKVDLREIWNGEAKDFTPWLAKEENILLLGETLNIELEVQDQEKNVGPFRADILCKDTLNDHYVLIENQLERTDHNHLGQLMTYAAGLDAVTIIWISKTFTEEHRATLDWLNRITEEGINFFGIEIEAYRIGNSPPAPMFNIISKPNDWSKTIRKSVTSGEVSEIKLMQQEYWQALRDFLESTGSFLKSQKPSPQHWTNFAIGRSYFHLSALVNSRDNYLTINIVIKGEDKQRYFEELQNNYEEDSKLEIDANLNWRPLPEAKESQVQLTHNANFNDKNDWANQHQWFKNYLEKFTKYFKPKIKELK